MSVASTLPGKDGYRAELRVDELALQAGAAFARGVFSDADQQAALEVFKWLAGHAEVDVRRNLAEHIKSSPMLPHSIALTLAQDIEAVATPILQSSLALTDTDLVSIIEDGSTAKQQAIASRETLSEVVSAALVDTGKEDVVEVLLANDGAEISEGSYEKLIDTFAENSGIHKLIVERPVLPFAVQERLVAIVSDELQAHLIEKHSFPAVLAERIVALGRERALIQSLATLTAAEEIEAASMRLYLQGTVTPTLLLRALCSGQLDFFGAALAKLASVPSENAQKALAKTGVPALRRLYEKSSLPAHLENAFQVALEIVLKTRSSKTPAPPAELEEKIVDGLVRTYSRLSPGPLEGVICQISRLGPED